MKTVTVLFFTLCLSLCRAQVKTAATTPSIENFMSVSEFRESGLQKLSPEEFAALNRWFGRYTTLVASAFDRQTALTSVTASPNQSIETHIEGEFTGWDGETIFKLENGQIWQQSSYAFTYHYAYRPKVLIYPSGSMFKMTVEGASGTIQVKRLK